MKLTWHEINANSPKRTYLVTLMNANLKQIIFAIILFNLNMQSIRWKTVQGCHSKIWNHNYEIMTKFGQKLWKIMTFSPNFCKKLWQNYDIFVQKIMIFMKKSGKIMTINEITFLAPYFIYTYSIEWQSGPNNLNITRYSYSYQLFTI